MRFDFCSRGLDFRPWPFSASLWESVERLLFLLSSMHYYFENYRYISQRDSQKYPSWMTIIRRRICRFPCTKNFRRGNRYSQNYSVGSAPLREWRQTAKSLRTTYWGLREISIPDWEQLPWLGDCWCRRMWGEARVRRNPRR